MAGFGPVVPGGESIGSADEHPLPVAARIAASAAVLRVLMFLVGLAVVGACVLL